MAHTLSLQFIEPPGKERAPLSKVPLLAQVLAKCQSISLEALWQAKLSPFRLTNTISRIEAERLLKELQDILRRAIVAGGSTLRDHIHPNGDTGYFQHEFKVYNRENKLCTHCQLTPLCKIMQSGRATYYCKACQQ